MPTPAPPIGGDGPDTGVEFNLFTWFTRTRAWYSSQPTLTFEAVTLGLAVLVGLLIMPALIYVAGRYTLDSYANGNLFSLYGDFFKGLFEPRSSNWIVVLGPFVFLSLFRLFRLILRKV
jgi:hypothetical protein